MDRILDFWFNAEDTNTLWWGKNENTDQFIRETFEADIDKAKRGELDDWADTPRGRLAMVILLDQFSRNIYRNDPKSYAQDAQALQLALDGIKKGDDQPLSSIERVFMYMPLEHAEDIDIQNQCVTLFEKLGDDVSADQKEPFAFFLKYAVQHRDIVEKFGHFPHRNHIVGRTTSTQEAAFLEQPGSSF
jgi:uncharacterized protein (DUF924 family)